MKELVIAFLSAVAPVVAFAFAPLWWAIERVLYAMDAVHRMNRDKIRSEWPYATVPHVRSVLARPADEAAPLTNWRLSCDEGRQIWSYEPNSDRPQNFIERYNLGLAPKQPVAPRESSTDAMRDGAKFLCRLQDEDGHWPNDYSGPLFLTPGLIFVKYMIAEGDYSKMFPTCPQQRGELLRYIVNHQNADGGWGTHTESHSTMFGSVLNYSAIRLLGEPADSDVATRGRAWIQSKGGAISIPSWGKMWLSIVGLYEYAGCDAIPPEMWLMPRRFIFSMGRFWCHSRIVTLPMGYLYGRRWHGPITPLIEAIRSEIYTEKYSEIDWPKQRHNVYKGDIYTPHSMLYDVASWFLQIYEKAPIKSLRDRALRLSYEHCKYDDTSTSYICLGPVNKALNMLIAYIEEGADSEHYRRHVERVDDYLFMGPEGMRMSGYNGSQLWDTSFAVQAICAAGLEDECPAAMAAAHHYIDVAQVQEDPPGDYEKYYRHRTKGAWNFSTRAQGWQVSDCTAEGLRVVLLLLRNTKIVPTPFPKSRIFDGVDEILSLRSEELGGWASYEAPRGPQYLELLDCAEIYKDIMIDYVYSECSSSCIHTLTLFRALFPDYRTEDVNRAIREGIVAVKAKQGRDGGFYGSWANCFTYAGWIVSDALHLAGEPADAPIFTRLSAFTLSKQNADGGWGEDFNSCVTGRYVQNPDGSQVVNTAWAVMTLIVCHHTSTDATALAAIDKGVQFIMSRQLADGDWAQERISGVFNGNSAIHYPGYKNSMTVWALGKYVNWRKGRGEAPI